MKLTAEEKAILNGKEGETKAKIMRTLVEFGDVFGAEELVPVTTNGHLVTSFGIFIFSCQNTRRINNIIILIYCNRSIILCHIVYIS